MMEMKLKNNRCGFSLIEVIISMAIISIVSVVIISSFSLASNLRMSDTDKRNVDTSAEGNIAQGANPDSIENAALPLPGGYYIPTDKNTVGNFDYISGSDDSIGAPLDLPGPATATYNVIATGKYKLEVWGAEGGTAENAAGGLGGYSVGTITLTQGDVLYLNAGGKGSNGGIGEASAGGSNGGGDGGKSISVDDGGRPFVTGGGGGASDIRVGSDSLDRRVIVAGGGGGGGGSYLNGTSSEGGGAGGGATGQNGKSSTESNDFGAGGTQTAGGATGSVNGDTTYGPGTFGVGGSQRIEGNSGGGGGGGWFGGGAGSLEGGGGGSGWVYTAASASMAPGFMATGLERYYLAEAQTTAGTTSVPDPNSYDKKTGLYSNLPAGNTGQGFVRITWVSK